MTFPPGYLRPIYRCEPRLDGGVFVIALDPREATFCLEHGAKLDGVRYRCDLNGWSGDLDYEGRVAVRCEINEHGCLSHREALMMMVPASP